MRSVKDPELGVNVVDLGLVYGIDIDGPRISIRLGLTSPTCPQGEHLAGEAVRRVREAMPDAGSVAVALVRDPPWHPGLMSGEARRALGWGG